MKPNVILFDNDPEEVRDFIDALQKTTGEPWQPLFRKANGVRDTLFKKLSRYAAYFSFPFLIFRNRNQYDKIFCWQQFYGLLFAFYCRVFFVKKRNPVFVKNFIYKPKKGWVGRIYFRFMKFILDGDYVDIYSFSGSRPLDYCKKTFPETQGQFLYLPFGVNDFSKTTMRDDAPGQDFILAIGRSNRDWEFLIDALAGTHYPVKILCDEWKPVAGRSTDTGNGATSATNGATSATNGAAGATNRSLPSHIEVRTDIAGDDSHVWFRNAKCLVIPIKDMDNDGGQTVLIKGLQFGKPVVVTGPSALSEEYIEDGINGVVVEKTRESLLSALDRIYGDDAFYETISRNARTLYEQEYSVETYGTRWGQVINAWKSQEEGARG